MKIKISRAQWESIGKTAGWKKEARDEKLEGLPGVMTGQESEELAKSTASLVTKEVDLLIITLFKGVANAVRKSNVGMDRTLGDAGSEESKQGSKGLFVAMIDRVISTLEANKQHFKG